MATSVSSSQKSTTVRIKMSRRIRRLALRTVEALAPSLLERWAAKEFLTPRRPKVVESLPLPSSFALRSGAFELRAWRWGDGPAVLLVHGWEGHAGQLQSFVEPLTARGFSVVAVDLPAHGHSSGRTTSVRDFADALAAVAAQVGPIHAVVAHSLGAAATALALGPRRPKGGRLQAERVVLLAPPEGPAHFVQAMIAQMGCSPAVGAGIVRRIQERVGLTFADLSVPSFAPQLDLPALVMHDPADRIVPFAHAQAIAAAWPGARLRPTPKLGHRRILTDPQVIAEVTAFITDHSI